MLFARLFHNFLSNLDSDALIDAAVVASAENRSAAVVASVLDGALEVLAGEVAGSVNASLRIYFFAARYSKYIMILICFLFVCFFQQIFT
jgi:hypothetical protein